MNLIYLDEAGIAADDPVTTVCGVIVRDDGQWQHAVDSVGKVIAQHVPAAVLAQNGGFIPHATQIMEDDYRSAWPLESRAAFLHDLLFVPYHSALTVVWAYTRSTYRLGGVPKNIRPEAVRHAFTFQLCVGDADECIRNALPMPAAGICICEDTDKRHLLQWVTSTLSRNPLTVPGMTGPYRIERMIDTVHFVKKGQAPLTALADVCAWAVKRYVGGNTEAEPYMRTLLATDPLREDLLELTRRHRLWLVYARIPGRRNRRAIHDHRLPFAARERRGGCLNERTVGGGRVSMKHPKPIPKRHRAKVTASEVENTARLLSGYTPKALTALNFHASTAAITPSNRFVRT